MKRKPVESQCVASNRSSESAVKIKALHKNPLAQSISAIIMMSVAGTGQTQVLDEVIVTATKREENIQDVPLAITAFTGDFIKTVNLDDIKDLVSFTPGVTGNSKDGFIDAISIRGVRTQDYGVGGDPSAAFFKNNLYEGRNGAVVTSLFDIDRAEILRGPQGFLFGRNAIGGAFNVHTRRPNLDGARDGYVEVDVGERNLFTVEGGATVALSDNFALRFAGYHSEEDGYVENLANPGQKLLGHDKTAFRVSGLYSDDKLEIFFSADHENMDRDGTIYRASELSPRLAIYQTALGAFLQPDDLRNANSDLTGGTDDDATITTLGLHINYDFDQMSLIWSTGYKDHDYLYIEDYDGTPINVETYQQDQTGSYFQTELRLTSNTDGPLSWYAGVSYYREEIDIVFTDTNEENALCAYYAYYYGLGVNNCSDYFDYWQSYYDAYYYPGYITVGPFVPTADGMLESTTIVDGRYNGWAAYIDVTYAINEQWDVSVGLRYSYDEKTFGVHVPKPTSMLQSFYFPGYFTSERLVDSADWSGTTPRVILRYSPNEETMLFASYTEGYKAGGFGTFTLEPAIYQWFGDGADDPLTAADGFVPAQFKPEDVTSYEVGYKGTLADGRVTMDVTAFMYEYTDLQVNYWDGAAFVGNAGNVDGQGIEASIHVAFNDNLNLITSIGYLDTEARGIQFLCGGAPDADGLLDGDVEACEGNKLYWAPDFSGSAVLRGDFPAGNGSIITNLEMFWESERGRGYEDIIDSQIDPFQEWAFRIGYASNNSWNVMAYVENFTNELTFDGAANNSGVIPAFYFGPSRPRTFGVRFGYTFE